MEAERNGGEAKNSRWLMSAGVLGKYTRETSTGNFNQASSMVVAEGVLVRRSMGAGGGGVVRHSREERGGRLGSTVQWGCKEGLI